MKPVQVDNLSFALDDLINSDCNLIVQTNKTVHADQSLVQQRVRIAAYDLADYFVVLIKPAQADARLSCNWQSGKLPRALSYNNFMLSFTEKSSIYQVYGSEKLIPTKLNAFFNEHGKDFDISELKNK